MRARRLSVPITLLALVAVLGLVTQARIFQSHEVPVKATVAGGGTLGLEELRIQSDGLGDYLNGQSAVRSVFDTSGNFVLDTNTSRRPAIRMLTLDFGSRADTSTCNPPFQSQRVDAFLSTLVVKADNSGRFFGGYMNMSVGQTLPARLAVSFADPNNPDLIWKVRLWPDFHPGTSYVQVTRTNQTTWEVVAPGSIAGLADTDVAELLSVPTTGKGELTSCGFFHMPLRITVTP